MFSSRCFNLRLSIRHLFLIFSVSLLSFDILAIEPPTPTELSKKQISKLIEQEILVKVRRENKLNKAEMYGVVDAPLDKVWGVVRDDKDVSKGNPDMKSVIVLEEKGEYKKLRGVNAMPWPMDDRYWDVNTISRPELIQGKEYYVSTWKYIEGTGNIIDLYGYWLLQPFGKKGEKTLIKYIIYMDLGLWLPNFILNWATSRILPNVIVNVRIRARDAA